MNCRGSQLRDMSGARDYVITRATDGLDIVLGCDLGERHLRAHELAHMRGALVGVGSIVQLQALVAFFLFFDVKLVLESSLHALDLVLEDSGEGDLASANIAMMRS